MDRRGASRRRTVGLAAWHSWSVLALGIALLAVASTTACGGGERSARTAGAAAAPTRLAVSGAALDAHVHLMSAELASRIGAEGASTGGDLIAKMDEADVQRAVVLSTAYMAALPDDAAMRAENDFAAAEVARYPDRLIGFCGINPLRTSAVEEIDRCTAKPQMRGLKLHLVGSQVDMANDEHVDALSRVLDRAEERGLPVLVHAANPAGLPLDSDGLTRFGTVVATHPNVSVVFAHSFSLLDNQQLEWLVAATEQGVFSRERVFIDLSASISTFQDAPLSERELMVWRLRKFGLDHVLFGSDYLRVDPTAATPAAALTALSAYPFTQAEIDSILSSDGSAWLGSE